MIKHFLALVFMFSAVFSLFAENTTSDGWKYEVKDGKATIFGSKSSTGDLAIPSNIDGYTVTSIRDYAFWECRGLTSVTITDTVTSIGNGAFSRCSGLKTVTIPDSVTSIGDGAFSSCSGLSAFTVSVGNPVYSSIHGLLCTKNGKTVVAGVNGDVTIPDGVTSIGDSAFFGYDGSVTSIGDGAILIRGPRTRHSAHTFGRIWHK